MATSPQRRLAEQQYYSGQALFQQGLYNEALIELLRAEDAFRELDARGHPFSKPLSNGVSGLANTLALSGRCFQKLGNYRSALTYYETSLINSKFERTKPLRTFLRQINEDISLCYEKVSETLPDREALLDRDPEIDISFTFPYSLPLDAIPFARLYELAPRRYPRYEQFYTRARNKDAEIRRQTKTSDDSLMKRMSIYIWSILFVIWAVYGLIALDALISSKK
jgi:tetratricopeptide (TPR) repeat protein